MYYQNVKWDSKNIKLRVCVVYYGEGEKNIYIEEFLKEISRLDYPIEAVKDSDFGVIKEYYNASLNVMINRRYLLIKKHKRLIDAIKKLFMLCAASTNEVTTINLIADYGDGCLKFPINTKMEQPEINRCLDAITDLLRKIKKVCYSKKYIDDASYSKELTVWTAEFKEKEPWDAPEELKHKIDF